MEHNFTTPCIINKNTPELCTKLEELGYFVLFSVRNGYAKLIHAYGGTANSFVGDAFHPIDCGTNEDLFLAIVALRSDSDKMQWFVYKDSWIQCLTDKWIHRLPYHKATVEELIEHFKTDSQPTAKDLYQTLKGQTITVTLGNADGSLSEGPGVVCGYQGKWLIVGFDHEYNGCVKAFSNHVHVDNKNFKSYRFWNIRHLDEKV